MKGRTLEEYKKHWQEKAIRDEISRKKLPKDGYFTAFAIVMMESPFDIFKANEVNK